MPESSYLGREMGRRPVSLAYKPVDLPFQFGQALGLQRDDFVAQGDTGPVDLDAW